MSARDTRFYIEQTGTRADGSKLFAMHNVTEADIRLFRQLLQEHRQRNVVLLTEGEHFTSPTQRSTIALENQRIDEINNPIIPHA